MNVVIPMAGRGTRFGKTGISGPKPLIPVAGKPMLARALKSIEGVSCSRMIFVALEEHEEQYGLSDLLPEFTRSEIELILLKDVTEGQLCTVLAARERINTEEDLLIISSDTYVVSNLMRDISEKSHDCQGIISVAKRPGDHWSFARTGDDGRVVEVAEKVRISDLASTGIYYFSNGRDFVLMADEMISREEKVSGEYYVIPVYQKYIKQGYRIDISLAMEMWDMGNPQALDGFIQYLSKN